MIGYMHARFGKIGVILKNACMLNQMEHTEAEQRTFHAVLNEAKERVEELKIEGE